MKRALNKHVHPEKSHKPHLTLVHGKGKHSHKHSYGVIGSFLTCSLVFLGLIFIFATKHTIDIEMATRSFLGLGEVYRQEGLQRFLEEKNALKTQIARTLENPANDEEEVFASNVAVYLFPDVLPKSNLEKSVATEQWASLEEAIEKSPRTPESRLWFEEMRANIWNYENPDRVFPKVSTYAKEALKIYDDLSSP